MSDKTEKRVTSIGDFMGVHIYVVPNHLVTPRMGLNDSEMLYLGTFKVVGADGQPITEDFLSRVGFSQQHIHDIFDFCKAYPESIFRVFFPSLLKEGDFLRGDAHFDSNGTLHVHFAVWGILPIYAQVGVVPS